MVQHSSTHAWFTGFAPYEDPQVVITVFVEEGGEGRYRRAYRSRNLQWWFSQYQVEPRFQLWTQSLTLMELPNKLNVLETGPPWLVDCS